MKTLLALLGYAVVATLLMGVLSGGVFWLIRPDPSLMREAKAAPIPPRIAESIERKRMPEPVATPTSVRAPIQEPMHEANVALRQPATKITIRELGPRPTDKRKRKARVGRTVTSFGDIFDSRATSPSIPMGRSDFPY